MWDWLSASDFTPRGSCGNWTEVWLSIYVVSQLVIAFSYFGIPFVLVVARWQHSITFHKRRRLLLLFSLFILFCGVGHILDGPLAFIWPNYRVFALWHLVTAFLSLATAIVLPRLLLGYLENK